MLAKSSFCLFGDNLKDIPVIDDFIHQNFLFPAPSAEMLTNMTVY